MSPAVAAAAVSSSSMSQPSQQRRRELAESEDIYFGRDHHEDENCYPTRPSATGGARESLLGQALQVPSNNFVLYADDVATDYYDSLSPMFVSRKTSNGNSSIHRQQRNAFTHNRAGSSSSGTTSSSTLNNVRDHLPDDHHHNSNYSYSSSTTRTVDNRNHDNFQHHANDPFCLSNRSVQSEDSVGVIIPQSVDTVPTSNVATFQQNQMKYANHKNKQTHSSNGGGYAHLPQQHHSSHYYHQANRSCVSPPPELRYHHPSVTAARTAAEGGANSSSKTRSLHSSANNYYNDHHGNHHHNNSSHNNNGDQSNSRRTVFGTRVQKRYPNYATQPAIPPPLDPAPFYNIIETGHHITFQQAAQQPPEWVQSFSSMAVQGPPPPRSNTPATGEDAVEVDGDGADDDHAVPLPVVVTASTTSTVSSTQEAAATPHGSTTPPVSHHDKTIVPSSRESSDLVSPLQSPPLGRQISQTSVLTNSNASYDQINHSQQRLSLQNKLRNHNHNKKKKSRQKLHETIHAQSLLLGLCFMAIWSPNNIMAPNLTQVATFYHMTESERDLYLGSFLALATGVLSFPLSALIGILTDLYPRKHLFVGTALGGAIASAATGCSPTYPYLLLARFFSGGFMSSSVSVAFSLLGDLFATEERNAASSGLTAMMGLGIILGQVYAGMVGNTFGWQHAFFVSSIVTTLLGLCVALLVQEPVRGGKEKVLQVMLRKGKPYDRKLTWDGFWHAMRHNRSNGILMLQGFFSSLPWGIIFVFLNDYLSQERGFSVPDATYIVFLFGIGCAVGGILGVSITVLYDYNALSP
jgi:predicted MFS family arabinose efflux permease